MGNAGINLPAVIMMISIGLQVAAAIAALRLIRLTGRSTAWILLSAAIALITWRRCFALSRLIESASVTSFDSFESLLTLVISILLLWGIVKIGPLFQSIRSAQQALEVSRRELSLLFSEMIDGFALHEIVLDSGGKPADFRFLKVNPAFERLTLLKADAIVGKTMRQVFPGVDPRWIETCCRVAETGEPVHAEPYFPQLEKHFAVTLYSPGENRFAAIFTDITEHKRIQDRLLHSEKLEAIGQLAGGVAHDFNNLLTGVMGYAELLMENVKDDQHRLYAENILKASQRATELTGQLLAFARKGKYTAAPVDVHQILDEVISLLGHSLDKRIAIVRRFEAGTAVVYGDAALLQNAFLNLGINGRDAMPAGGELIFSTAVVKVDGHAVGPRLPEGSYLRVSVSDTGVGMTAETRKHLFEPFFTTKEKGTGLGLAAVYGTVKSHHGAIDAASEEGHGATFKVYLPLLKDGVAPDKPVSARSTPVKGADHILVVDDEEMVLGVVSEMLRTLGYRVAAFTDGAEAAAYYERYWHTVDLVILDMIMPRMSGHAVFLAMRKINPQIKALLSSGYSVNGDAQRILDEGMLGFIQKPFMRGELSEKVRAVLDRAG